SCRICRGEATNSQPLFHPCNCRGSIKYVHQGCLFEWLKHSNKSTHKCDICNTEYKFKTIYDPEMPQRIPVGLILSKFTNFVSSGILKSISVTLYVLFLLQLPMFWKFAGRVYTWAIDGTLPQENPSVLNALLLGRFDISSHRNAVTTGSPTDLLFVYAEHIFQYTYYSGVRHIFVFLLVHIALFIEHEWVVRDEGYTKSLMKRIGKEPRTKLLDMLQQALTALRNDGDNGNAEAAQNVHQLEMLARAIDDLQNEDPNARPNGGPNQFQNTEEELRRITQNGDLFGDNMAPVDPLPNNNFEFDNDNDELDDDAVAAEEAEALAAAAANANGGGDFLELFGFAFDIKTPIICTIMADSIIAVYLFAFYFIPHTIGSTVASFSRISVEFAYLSIKQYFIEPVWLTIASIFIEPNPTHTTFLERLSLLAIGYGIIGYTIYALMNSLTAGKKPVLGGSRKVFKILFEITSTFKVFFIFALEIVLFPMYCGWLLDFCGAPVVLPRFSVSESDGSKSILLLLSSISEFTQASHTRLYGYWVIGTAYMLCIALFVGMVRNKILRPGVLFFIRSPEDPNARLIHDALVKPLMLQMSRIYLSAKVYTVFILAGIGGITWSLRLFNMGDLSEDSTWRPSLAMLLSIPFHAATINSYFSLLQKYVHKYWKRVFEISAHKVRLSHFILGKPVSQERGYIVYRNVFLQLLGTSQPDYSRPTTYREAIKIFEENPEVKACFVPNGSYVRVPDNDTVCRKYVKKLFVAVTKDDKLITAPAQSESSVQSGYETPTSDEEQDVNTDNRYTIVYRPPNLKTRCFGLLGILWGFSVILCVSVFLISLVIGRPVVRALGIIFHFMEIYKGEISFKNSFPLDWNLDVYSIGIGFRIIMILLESFDKRLDERQTPGEVPAEQGAAAPQEFNIPNEALPANLGANNRLRIDLGAQFVFTFVLWMTVWVGGVHLYCVEIPARFYHQLGHPVPVSLFELNRFTTPLHLLVSYWTIFVYLKYPVAWIKMILQDIDGEFDGEPTKVWLKLLLIDFACVWGPSVISAIGLKVTGYDQYLVYDKALIFSVYAGIKLLLALISAYNSLVESVKNEKYVRGRTIQNID
ncbi:uncharacterized protein CANTADRAFT_30582, partial [Suhomyces tanzawaensis NRRL Y-17324]